MSRLATPVLICLCLATSAFAQSPNQKLGPGLKMVLQASRMQSGAFKRAIAPDRSAVSVLVKGFPRAVRGLGPAEK